MRASFTHHRTKKYKIKFSIFQSRVSRLFFLFPIFVFLGAPRRLRTSSSWSRISACEDAYDAVEGETEFEFDFFIHFMISSQKKNVLMIFTEPLSGHMDVINFDRSHRSLTNLSFERHKIYCLMQI